MEIAIAILRIERLNRNCYQEIALSCVANALTSRCMADALDLVQRVRNVICERGLFENPLAIGLGKQGNREEQEG